MLCLYPEEVRDFDFCCIRFVEYNFGLRYYRSFEQQLESLEKHVDNMFEKLEKRVEGLEKGVYAEKVISTMFLDEKS